MKKTKIDRSIDTEALGFQVRESYKTLYKIRGVVYNTVQRS